ncbi:MAG: hypothetical protein WDO13_16510 [Verrucomicrobiota bacterium]
MELHAATATAMPPGVPLPCARRCGVFECFYPVTPFPSKLL